MISKEYYINENALDKTDEMVYDSIYNNNNNDEKGDVKWEQILDFSQRIANAIFRN